MNASVTHLTQGITVTYVSNDILIGHFRPKLPTKARLTWDQAVFSFRFENYIPAVAVRENAWEQLKLGLILG